MNMLIVDPSSAQNLLIQPAKHLAFRRTMGTPLPVPVLKDSRILDLGCGEGCWALDMAETFPNVEITEIDNNSTILRYAETKIRSVLRKNVTAEFGNITALSYPSNIFDLVHWRGMETYILQSMEEHAIREAWRVLSKNGQLCVVLENAKTTSSPALNRLEEILQKAKRNCYASFLRDHIERLLVNAGFTSVVNRQQYTLDFSADSCEYPAMTSIISLELELYEDFLVNSEPASLSVQRFDDLYQRSVSEMADPGFTGSLQFEVIVATK